MAGTSPAMTTNQSRTIGNARVAGTSLLWEARSTERGASRPPQSNEKWAVSSPASQSSPPDKFSARLSSWTQRHEVIMTTQTLVRSASKDRRPSSRRRVQRERARHDPEFLLPACVCLNGEQMIILPTAEGIGKFALRIENEHGELRVLTRDEQLALAVAPGTRVEQAAATGRVELPEGGLQLVLLPQPWQQGDLASVLWQLQQRNTNGGVRN
jgi:hypothetical protein